jgi:hypothetical protein
MRLLVARLVSGALTLGLVQCSRTESAPRIDADDSAPSDDAAAVDVGHEERDEDARDAEASSYCANLPPLDAGVSTQRGLCADFDDGSLVDPASQEIPPVGFAEISGDVRVDSATLVSPPWAFEARQSNTDARLTRRFVSLGSWSFSVHLGFDVRLGEAATQDVPSGHIVHLGMMGDTCAEPRRCNFDVIVTDGAWRLETSTPDPDGGPPSSIDLTTPPMPGQWSRVDITVTLFFSGDVRASVLVDGKEVSGPAGSGRTRCARLCGPPELSIGLWSATPGVVRFDNVLLEGQ